MTPEEVAEVLTKHGTLHRCIGGDYVSSRSAVYMDPPCLPYRMAEALAASEAKVAKVAKFDHILDQYTDGKISKVACVSLMLNAADS